MKPAAIAIAILLVSGAAQAQPSGWGAAGGGLFPQAPEPAESLQPADPPAPLEADAGHAAFVPSPVQPYAELIAAAATRHGLDPKLLHALILVESRYDARAVSPAGAVGLAQLMPATGVSLGVTDRLDPQQNVQAGAAYLARQLLRFGDVRLALAAYNAGPARVARLGRIPDIAETQAYVAAVVECYLALTAGRSVRSSGTCRRP